MTLTLNLITNTFNVFKIFVAKNSSEFSMKSTIPQNSWVKIYGFCLTKKADAVLETAMSDQSKPSWWFNPSEKY